MLAPPPSRADRPRRPVHRVWTAAALAGSLAAAGAAAPPGPGPPPGPRPVPVVAQVTTVDEGSFVLTRRGERIGREEFRIVRQPAGGGVEIVARGLAAFGERRISPALQCDSTGSPLRYQVEVRAGRTPAERLTGQYARGHFGTQAQTERGEAAREYLLPDRTVLVDVELVHQLHFLVMRRDAGDARVPVLVPRAGALVTARVAEEESERLTIGGEGVEARRLRVRGLPGGVRLVWIDARGRLLRVAVPDDGLLAQRDELPR